MKHKRLKDSNMDRRFVAELAGEIKERVCLTNMPIGISFIKDEVDIPDKARRPSLRGMAWPFCLSENIVRVLGWTIALTLADHFCMFGAAGLGHMELPEYLQNGAIGCQHTKTRKLGLQIQEWVEAHFLKPESAKGIMLTPATDPLFVPQAVFIYGNPTQVGKIAKGIAWYRGEPVYGTAGAFGCCIVAASSAITNRTPRVVIPSAGAKILGHCEENEILIALPVEDLPHIVAGMKATDFLLPYPTGKYLMIEPRKVPEGYPINLLSHKTYKDWKEKGARVLSNNMEETKN